MPHPTRCPTHSAASVHTLSCPVHIFGLPKTYWCAHSMCGYPSPTPNTSCPHGRPTQPHSCCHCPPAAPEHNRSILLAPKPQPHLRCLLLLLVLELLLELLLLCGCQLLARRGQGFQVITPFACRRTRTGQDSKTPCARGQQPLRSHARDFKQGVV